MACARVVASGCWGRPSSCVHCATSATLSCAISFSVVRPQGVTGQASPSQADAVTRASGQVHTLAGANPRDARHCATSSATLHGCGPTAHTRPVTGASCRCAVVVVVAVAVAAPASQLAHPQARSVTDSGCTRPCRARRGQPSTGQRASWANRAVLAPPGPRTMLGRSTTPSSRPSRVNASKAASASRLVRA